MQFCIFEFLYVIGIVLVYNLSALLSVTIIKSIKMFSITLATTVTAINCRYY